MLKTSRLAPEHQDYITAVNRRLGYFLRGQTISNANVIDVPKFFRFGASLTNQLRYVRLSAAWKGGAILT
jgi:hypothetical protein